MRNFELKIFALLVAVLLAVYVNSERNTSQIGIVVAVELSNVPNDRVVLEPLNPRAQVTIKGPRFLVSQVPQSPPEIRIRVPSDVGASFPVSLTDQHLELPLGVQVVSIEPAQIEFRFDELLVREVPAVVPRIGSLTPTLVLNQFTTAPEKVQIRGPAQIVSTIARVESEPVDMREIKESTTRPLVVRLTSPLVQSNPASLSLVVDVSPRQSERTFEGLPVELRAAGVQNLLLDPAVAVVELSGPQEILQRITPEEVIPYVRLKAGETIPEELEVLVDVPPQIVVVEVVPGRVRVQDSSKPPAKPTVRSETKRGKR